MSLAKVVVFGWFMAEAVVPGHRGGRRPFDPMRAAEESARRQVEPAAAQAPRARAAWPVAGWRKTSTPLPEFTLSDTNGKVWTLADLKGKVALVSIWAAWCGPCKQELPQVEALYRELKDRPDVVVLALNVDTTLGKAALFARANRMTLPVLYGHAYVKRMVPRLEIPRTWIVSRAGVLVAEQVGFRAQEAGQWLPRARAAIEAELAAAPPRDARP